MAVSNAGQGDPSRNEIIVGPRLIMVGLLDSRPQKSRWRAGKMGKRGKNDQRCIMAVYA